jgi:hypothetical protein
LKTLGRRKFLQYGFLSTAVLLTSGCDLFGIVKPIDTIRVMQKDLFPKVDELGLDTASYMNIIFHHTKITKEDKQHLKNGVKWLNEESIKLHKLNYTQLHAHQREDLLREISKTKWGDAFIYNIFSFLFEAMLGDPIYGGNKNKAAWKWLNFEGGKPMANKVYL